MKPVMQTLFAGPGIIGNCWQACIASILELPLEEVPHFYSPKPAEGAFKTAEWLEEHGFAVIITNDEELLRPECYHIVIGRSPRGTQLFHSVVALGNKLVHDPHPEATFLVGEPFRSWLIIPRDIVRIKLT